ncbi:MAG: lysylphosphatidylglycerol synthase transmembrane domain-containing protein [Promethearchaeati archaeon SRVP18_Atabeyarchaeia-1]
MNKKSILLYIVAFLLLILMLWYIGVEQIVANLVSVNIPLLAIAAFMHSFSVLLRGVRWKYILETSGNRISTANSWGLIYLGWFANGLVPAKVGDIVRAFAVRKQNNCPLGKGFASLVIERILDTTVIVVLVILSLLLVSQTLGFVSSANWVTLSIILGVALAHGLAVFAILCIKKQSFVAGVFTRLFGSKHAKETKGFAQDLGSSFTDFASRKKVLLGVVLLSLVIWLLNFPKFYVVFMSMGLYPPLALVATATFISDAWGMVPITPGGIGAVEFGQTAFVIYIVGISSPALAAAVVLLDRVVSFWIPMLIGGTVSIKTGASFSLSSSTEPKKR